MEATDKRPPNATALGIWAVGIWMPFLCVVVRGIVRECFGATLLGPDAFVFAALGASLTTSASGLLLSRLTVLWKVCLVLATPLLMFGAWLTVLTTLVQTFGPVRD